MTRVLVTGANGFIAAGLIPTLTDAGHEVVALGRRDPPPDLGALTRWHLAELGGTGDPPQAALDGVDTVVHLAGLAHSEQPDTEAAKLRLQEVNVAAAATLAENAAAEGASQFVFLSSATVHGSESGARAIVETDPLDPAGLYARSKVEAEQALQNVAASTGLALTIVRPPLVYGPGVKGNLARLLDWAEAGRPLPSAVFRNRRSFIALSNLCRFLELALTRPEARGEAFLVSDNLDLSTGELFRALSAACGRSPRILPLSYAVLAPALRLSGHSATLTRLCGDFRLDTTKSRRLMDWQPDDCLEEELQRAAAVHKKHRRTP